VTKSQSSHPEKRNIQLLAHFDHGNVGAKITIR